MMQFAADKILEGVKYRTLLDELVEAYQISETAALRVIQDCKDKIKSQRQIKVPFILSTHIERYEFLYEKFEQIGRTDLINIVLNQKEELIQLRKMVSAQLAEDFVSVEVENKFDPKRLSPEKLARVGELILKGMIDD